MNPDYSAGMRAFDQGHPLDPKQRGQWRRGWERARDNRVQRVRGELHRIVRESRQPAQIAAAECLLNCTDEILIAVYGPID